MGTIPKLSVLKGCSRPLRPNLLNSIFEEIADSAAGENLALIFEELGSIRKYTYSEMNVLTNRLARSIRQKILENNLTPNKDGDYIIAVSMHPSDYLVITLLAVLKVGAAYLPLDAAFPKQRVEHILREAKPAIVIYDNDQGNFLNFHKLSVDDFLGNHNKFSSNSIRNEEHLSHSKEKIAIILYTSGSTGVPKGVRLPHATILNRLQWQFKTFPYSSTERTGIFKTALTFVDSVSEIWGPLISGLAVLVVPKATTQDPEKLVTILETFKIERLVLVPSLLRSLLMYFQIKETSQAVPHLRTWICSGETLSASLVQEFYKYFDNDQYRLCNFYGSTEIMGDVTYHIISSLNEVNTSDKIPIGLPVDNTIIYLLDSEFRPVKTGDVGELFVSGLNLAAGYVNGRDPEKFIENPLAVNPMYAKLYRTGDFARIHKGTILYEGRTDSQVKIRGHRVDLSEIEKAVYAIRGVEKAIVLCYKPGEFNQAVLAFITTESSLNEYQIEDILKRTLTSYMVPQVVLVDDIPLLVNGKIDRQSLLKSYESFNTNNNGILSSQQEIDYTGVPEYQAKAAKVLFETIASILNRSARKVICIDANFYDIGGNSLNSIFTITTLNEKGYHISIADFIAAIDLGEVLDRMSPDSQILSGMVAKPPSYTAELLEEQHKADVIEMITTSFYQKADLEQWIITELHEGDYKDLIEKIWKPLVSAKLSFIIKTETGKPVGVALNFDATDEPEVEIHSKLEVIFEFLESIEGPIRDSQVQAGKTKILHSFMMATYSTLMPKENVSIIKQMEEEVIKIARSRNFDGILSTNTNPLTQQLASDVFSYNTLLNYQVNEYVAEDNTKPFGMAPDSQRAIVQWKTIN